MDAVVSTMARLPAGEQLLSSGTHFYLGRTLDTVAKENGLNGTLPV